MTYAIRCLALLVALSISTAAACPPPNADFDGNGSVNVADLSAFRALFGTDHPQPDLDCSGRVNFTDLAMFAMRFGSTPPRYRGLQPYQMGIVINTDEPGSEELALYYRQQRSIPWDNVARLSLGAADFVERARFVAARAALETKLPSNVQALALAFTRPSAIFEMRNNRWERYNSITSGFAYGFYERPAGSNGSHLGYRNPYTPKHEDAEPYSRHGMLISMMLTGPSLEHAKRVIDRGVRADRSYPSGEAILMENGTVRDLRARAAPPSQLINGINLEVRNGWAVRDAGTLLFYFQALGRIPELIGPFPPANTSFPQGNRLLPGAYLDTLTSCAGIPASCGDPPQTTVWQFLAAGATASHGTVEEPYAIVSKFVDPAVLIDRYTRGDTIIEAIWKSLVNPYQGLVVGEPLAAPWRREL